MAATPMERDLRFLDADPPDDGPEDGREADGVVDGDRESLRDTFVEAFNDRDLDALRALVAEDVELLGTGEGVEAFAEEVAAIFERSPGAVLTRALLDGIPCAVGWLPDGDGGWSRAALVCVEPDDAMVQVALVGLPDDADALDRAEAAEPTGEELDEWDDWAEWDRGEETPPRPRH